jgi:hypothetical protein
MNATLTSTGRRKIASTSQKQFREWVSFLISLCVIGLILVSAFVNSSSALFSHVSSESNVATVNPRTGAILVETDPAHCRQFTFDNDSGKIVPSTAACEQQLRDAEGAPAPIGTIHRLDAISKSFFGR